ncbi:hypothetical protein H0H81_001404 [Sphagnurus paluster]|uniref:AB hydrolase-1 domain-containing protein n=1 Tax=Sphagnurus paluster TaxID=117069 RepID=A0A9P7FTL3_9AGAR|nr:hypothetical protein H0H81_001404 [Sphagnurus paluster]
MSTLVAEEFTLTTSTQDGIPLLCTMKRYTSALGKGPRLNKPSAILLLGHGAGFPKETWEPTLEDLFALDDQQPASSGALRVREAWALDYQNHGATALVNATMLAVDPGIVTIYDYAAAFASLRTSGLLGALDPALHKVILVGHSAGSVGVTLATGHFNPPFAIPFASLILVDPPIFPRRMRGQEMEMYKLVAVMTPLRRDIWESREAAAKWMRPRPPCQTWDQRVFNAYVKHGLTSLPTPYYPEKNVGVTLTTHRSGENIAFTGERFTYHALYRLNQICADVPVHLVYGAENDMFPRVAQGAIVDVEEGRVFASIRRIEGVGHLVVQDAPLKLARTLLAILRNEPLIEEAGARTRSKL